MREFIRMINEEKCGVVLIADRAGVDRKTIYDWRTRHMPTIDKLDACGNVLGYKLAWVPIDQEDPDRRMAYLKEQRDDGKIGLVVSLRSNPKRGEIIDVDGRYVTVRWGDGMKSREYYSSLVEVRAFDHTTDCPHCGALDSQIKLHGHVQCRLCGGIIESCCGD